jgi:hypothetical protein
MEGFALSKPFPAATEHRPPLRHLNVKFSKRHRADTKTLPGKIIIAENKLIMA